jgi:hypothetical protein
MYDLLLLGPGSASRLEHQSIRSESRGHQNGLRERKTSDEPPLISLPCTFDDVDICEAMFNMKQQKSCLNFRSETRASKMKLKVSQSAQTCEHGLREYLIKIKSTATFSAGIKRKAD